jgi:hypothetical protein
MLVYAYRIVAVIDNSNELSAVNFSIPEITEAEYFVDREIEIMQITKQIQPFPSRGSSEAIITRGHLN